jgi:hypothetical protein
MTFEQDTEETPVVFRFVEGEVTAVFPCEPADLDGRSMACYAHVGQHSGCSHEFARSGRPAKPAEYAALKAELEGPPYRYHLKVYNRVQPAHREAFRAEVQRLHRISRAS